MKDRSTKGSADISTFYNQGLSTWAIADKLNVDHKTIIYHLRKRNIQLRNRSDAAKVGVLFGRIAIKKKRIPKNLILNKHLAYILGVLAGDGYMAYNTNRRNYFLGLSATDKEFVDKFRKAISNFFKLTSSTEFRKPRNTNWRAQYISRLCSKEACEYIASIGQFRKENWFVPKNVLNSNLEIKCHFLKGFFDSEGDIDKANGRVGATSMNIKGLTQVKLLLEGIGIRSTIILKKDSRLNTNQKYVLRIHDKKSLILFNTFIGFIIKRKQEILNRFINRWA
jgi:intein-encoded DNA endonuclease-like protein